MFDYKIIQCCVLCTWHMSNAPSNYGTGKAFPQSLAIRVFIIVKAVMVLMKDESDRSF